MGMGTTGYGLTPENPWEFQEQWVKPWIFEPEGKGDFFWTPSFPEDIFQLFFVDWWFLME